MSAAKHVREASSAEKVNDQCEKTSEWTSEWPSIHVPIFGLSEPQCSGLEGFVFFSAFALSVWSKGKINASDMNIGVIEGNTTPVKLSIYLLILNNVQRRSITAEEAPAIDLGQ